MLKSIGKTLSVISQLNFFIQIFFDDEAVILLTPYIRSYKIFHSIWLNKNSRYHNLHDLRPVKKFCFVRSRFEFYWIFIYKLTPLPSDIFWCLLIWFFMLISICRYIIPPDDSLNWDEIAIVAVKWFILIHPSPSK